MLLSEVLTVRRSLSRAARLSFVCVRANAAPHFFLGAVMV